jgi:hypothetical protein
VPNRNPKQQNQTTIQGTPEIHKQTKKNPLVGINRRKQTRMRLTKRKKETNKQQQYTKFSITHVLPSIVLNQTSPEDEVHRLKHVMFR